MSPGGTGTYTKLAVTLLFAVSTSVLLNMAGTTSNAMTIQAAMAGRSTPADVTTTPTSTHSFNGTVEVTSDGTVAVMYYDFRNNTTDPGLPTDVWMTHSSDGGATWGEQHVYGPFDMEKAPVARGWFLGDYQGLAAIDRDLILFFSVATGAEDSADVIAIRATATP